LDREVVLGKFRANVNPVIGEQAGEALLRKLLALRTTSVVQSFS
jgi:hypothetical protein